MKRLPFFVLSIIALVFIFSFYSKVILHPNEHMFSDSGDGIKNYFTYAYHIEKDSTYTNFQGMNYPYGENYLYTDCHPILANTLKYLSAFFPSINTHSVGILNLILILSIFLTFIILYAVLVEIKFNKWFALLFSFSIVLLAPQLFRLQGHYALSYSMAIPLAWLLMIKYFKNPRVYLLLLLILNNLFWLLIHAYLGMIVIAFVFSVLAVEILSDSQKRKSISCFLRYTMVAFLPVIIFYIYAYFTDDHVGRTNNPSGFFLYNAELDDILIPHHKPFRPILNLLTGDVIKLKWEAWGYLGFMNSLFFIAAVFLAIFSLFHSKSRNLLKPLFANKLLNISLIAGFIVLLFAFAIPFKQFPQLLDIFPVFKQFRATGRFVWPFYFVFTVFAAFQFQQIFFKLKNSNKHLAAWAFIILIFGISSWEAYHYHVEFSKRLTKSPNLFNKELLPKDIQEGMDGINTDEYQAIISLPFYYQGSESFSRPRVDAAVRNSIILSYHTGIPNFCANLTRTSVEESKRIVQLVSPNYYQKYIEQDLPSKKPFLIIKSDQQLTKYEAQILKKGKSLFKSSAFEVFHIDYKDLFSDDREDIFLQFQEIQTQLIQQDGFLVSKPSSVLYYNGFEHHKSDTTFRGIGAYVFPKKGKNILVEFEPHTFIKDQDYDLSVWMYNKGQDAINMYFRLIVEEWDEENDIWYSTTIFPDRAETINENWSLVEGVFQIKDPKNKVYIVAKAGEDSDIFIHADELLIKESGLELYRKGKEALFYNNHDIRNP